MATIKPSIIPIRGAEQLSSEWRPTEDVVGIEIPMRLEGEISDVMVRGTIPDCIDGTFYRTGGDLIIPAKEDHKPFDHNGIVSAFRIKNGRVDFKTRFVQNDLYKIFKAKRKGLLSGLKENELLAHPCVRAVLQQISTVNVMHWGGSLLVLGEFGPAYTMDPHTLETTGMDPYGAQIGTNTFTAHPHIDPFTDSLIAYSVDVSGKGQLASYSVSRQGIVSNVHRFPSPIGAMCHDFAMTENWLIFCVWPTSLLTDPELGETRLVWKTDIPTRFIVAPRHPDQPLAGSGWRPYESRTYEHPENSGFLHTAGAWEVDGKIYFEGTWPHNIHSSVFPFLGSDPKQAFGDTVVDLARFMIDPSKPDKSTLEDPEVLVNIPTEFCRIDERYLTRPYENIFMNVFHSDPQAPITTSIYYNLNAVAMLNKRTKEFKMYYPGPNTRCQETVFIPRSDDAPEGDGYIMFSVDRLDVNVTNVVILDTMGDFKTPVAVIELPIRIRCSVHGNWVDGRELGPTPLVPIPPLHHMNLRLPNGV
ncbi:lignostilbene dioxygenase family protein [Aspergillus terreus]|uniref:Lignostilbene dioxygenase family protein n=1 Tax=Aspergillus terreus TaxID=33178 RepID=A0A5M3ZDK1_ASPTE|nr:hypothetical protein ATETN484_0017000200 [Aspergillus terreus]GFF21681.1 lignostilbene dioxygenase family protein [Aspergillus terreus]